MCVRSRACVRACACVVLSWPPDEVKVNLWWSHRDCDPYVEQFTLYSHTT